MSFCLVYSETSCQKNGNVFELNYSTQKQDLFLQEGNFRYMLFNPFLGIF